MKTIDDIIKRIQPSKQTEILSFLNLKKFSESKVKESLLNIFTLCRLLSSLSKDELKIFKQVYINPDGISIGDLQKFSSIDADDIERILANLNSLLLVHIIKNRQMLNKKMDRAFPIQEIADIINLSDIEDIKKHLELYLKNLTEKADSPPAKTLDEKSISIMKIIAERGSIISVDRILTLMPLQELDKKVNELLQKGHLVAFNIITDTHRPYIAISEKSVAYIASLCKKGNLPKDVYVRNNYNLLVALLRTYDVISSSGLFLTKQNRFRKIDIKKIADSIISLKTVTGEEFPEEEKAHLSMSLLNILSCLRVDKDIGVISLKNISDRIHEPLFLLKSIVTKLYKGIVPEDVFCGDFKLPDFSYLNLLARILTKTSHFQLNYLRICFLIASATNSLRELEEFLGSTEEALDKEFFKAVNFFVLCGIAAVEEGKIFLTEEGNKIYLLMSGKTLKEQKELTEKKFIHINPDFTLMIHHREASPDVIYKVMSYIEIIKEDVVIEGAITKNSIVSAVKRGMNIELFLDVLKSNSRNEIPQSLEFLIKDWTQQTISIKITRPVVLYSSHGNFIDEILYSNYAKAVIARISENYCIIKQDSIDDIVKFSKKYDIILTVFEDEEG